MARRVFTPAQLEAYLDRVTADDVVLALAETVADREGLRAIQRALMHQKLESAASLGKRKVGFGVAAVAGAAGAITGGLILGGVIAASNPLGWAVLIVGGIGFLIGVGGGIKAMWDEEDAEREAAAAGRRAEVYGRTKRFEDSYYGIIRDAPAVNLNGHGRMSAKVLALCRHVDMRPQQLVDLLEAQHHARVAIAADRDRALAALAPEY